jgi:hypothetical protein
VAATLDDVVRSLDAVVTAIRGMTPSGGGAGPSPAGGLSAIMGAVGSAVSGVMSAVSSINSFTEALNPSAVLVFQQALYDLTAVVGVALEPLTQALTAITREVGAILLPIMEELAPLFQAIGQTLQTVFTLLSEMSRVFQPLIAPLVQALNFLLEALRVVIQPMIALWTVVRTVVETLVQAVRRLVSSLFPDINLNAALGGIRDFVNELIKYTLLVTAHIAKWLGADSYIDNLIKNLDRRDRKDATGLGAAKNATISTLPAFVNAVATSAFTATETKEPGQSPEEAWRRQTLAELERLRNGQETALDRLGNRIVDAITGQVGRAAAAATAPVTRLGLDAAVGSLSALGYVRRGIGSLFGERE